MLQRRAVNNDDVSEVPPIVHEVLRSPGQPLDPETRTFFEPRFSHDFSRAEVHTVNLPAINHAISNSAKSCQPSTNGLRIGKSDDEYEHEASRVADEVIRMPNHGVGRAPTAMFLNKTAAPRIEGDLVQGKYVHFSNEQNAVQRRPQPVSSTGIAVAKSPPLNHEVLHPLDQVREISGCPIRKPRFVCDLSHVRIHNNAQATESSRAVNALAYTVGQHIVFGNGQHKPGTSDGKQLLAHELAHVIQQGLSPARIEATNATDMIGDVCLPDAPIDHEAKSSSNLQYAPVWTLRRSPMNPRLQRAICEIKHVEKECNQAAASCMTVQDECKKRYPKPSDIDAAVKKGREKSKELASEAPDAAANMLHFLDGTGTEKVMSAAVFENHEATQKALLVHRQKFLDGARKRLENGSLTPGTLSEQMAWTDTANAFSIFKKDNLGYAVGGYTLCSKVRVRTKNVGANMFEVTFEDWTVQAFDCYNWDPGKSVGIPGASDTDMCCIENAGKGKHYRIRTDEWKNKDVASTGAGKVRATLPAPSSKMPAAASAAPVFPSQTPNE